MEKNKFVFVEKTNLLTQETNFTVWIGNLFLGNLFSIDLLNQKNKFVFSENKFVFRITNRENKSVVSGHLYNLKSPICCC